MAASLEHKRQMVERLLETDLSVAEWCKRNNIKSSTMYGWIAYFIEHEPDLFGGKENVVPRTERRWFERTRQNMRKSRSLAKLEEDGFMLLEVDVPVSPLSTPDVSLSQYATDEPSNQTDKSSIHYSDESCGIKDTLPAGYVTIDSHTLFPETQSRDSASRSSPPIKITLRDCVIEVFPGTDRPEVSRVLSAVRDS